MEHVVPNGFNTNHSNFVHILFNIACTTYGNRVNKNKMLLFFVDYYNEWVNRTKFLLASYLGNLNDIQTALKPLKKSENKS